MPDILDAYSGLLGGNDEASSMTNDQDHVDPVLAAYMDEVMKMCTSRLAAAQVSGFAKASIDSWKKDDYTPWSPWQPRDVSVPTKSCDHSVAKTGSNFDNTVGTLRDRNRGTTYVALKSDLWIAARQNEIEEVKGYLEFGFDVNMKSLTPNEESPLHNAVIGGHPKMINFLCDKGADVNIEDDSGNSPLHYAAQHGHVQCVRTLVKRGANKIAKNHVGYTPYQIALLKGHKKVAKLLPNRQKQKMFKLKFAASLMNKEK